MALATFRNTETGDLLELSEDWLDRFPKDPYERVGVDDLAKLEIEQRQAIAAAVGAQQYQQPGETVEAPAAEPAPASPAAGKGTDAGDTPTPPTNTRDDRRF